MHYKAAGDAHACVRGRGTQSTSAVRRGPREARSAARQRARHGRPFGTGDGHGGEWRVRRREAGPVQGTRTRGGRRGQFEGREWGSVRGAGNGGSSVRQGSGHGERRVPFERQGEGPCPEHAAKVGLPGQKSTYLATVPLTRPARPNKTAGRPFPPRGNGRPTVD